MTDEATTNAMHPEADNDLPVGDFPGGCPRGLVVLAWIAWGAWFIFLLAMMIYRLNTATR